MSRPEAGKGARFRGSQVKFRESNYFCQVCGKGPKYCKCKAKNETRK